MCSVSEVGGLTIGGVVPTYACGMFHRIDLQALAERSGPERAFLSVYLPSQAEWSKLDGRKKRVRDLLEDEPQELKYFERNLELVEKFFDEHKIDGALCVFACWATDYLQGFRLEKEPPTLFWVDSSPYIRPIAELQDEFENFVVLTVDNTDSHIYFVSSSTPDEEERVKGDIKNSVKKGGWSQQRYARRREKELLHYAKEVVEALEELGRSETFDRIILLGSDEAMREVQGMMSEALKEKLVGKRSVDLHNKDEVWETAFEIFFEEERASERTLWDKIKGEYMRGGRAVVGAEHVLDAAVVGRVEHMIVTRDAKMAGMRCRECENLSAEVTETCPVCDSGSVFKVDLINELVELVAGSSGETEFSDHIRGLTKGGHVAALLRY